MEHRQEARLSFAEVDQTGKSPHQLPCFGGRFEMSNSGFCYFYVCQGFFFFVVVVVVLFFSIASV